MEGRRENDEETQMREEKGGRKKGREQNRRKWKRINTE